MSNLETPYLHIVNPTVSVSLLRLNEPVGERLYARLLDAAMDLPSDVVPVEAEYAVETMHRDVDEDKRLRLTHVIELLDGIKPIESRVDYHLHPEDPGHSTVSFSIHSPTEGFSIRSNRPKQMIVENTDGEVIDMFDPANPNGTDPRYTELARYAQGFWTGDPTIHDVEEPTYRMRANDAYVLADLMTGKPIAEKQPVHHFSGHKVRDTAKNLYRRLKP